MLSHAFPAPLVARVSDGSPRIDEDTRRGSHIRRFVVLAAMLAAAGLIIALPPGSSGQPVALSTDADSEQDLAADSEAEDASSSGAAADPTSSSDDGASDTTSDASASAQSGARPASDETADDGLLGELSDGLAANLELNASATGLAGGQGGGEPPTTLPVAPDCLPIGPASRPTVTTTIPPTTTTRAWVEPEIDPPELWVDGGNGVALPDLALRIRFCESTNNYLAANISSTARGAYQFLTSTWEWYGYADRYGVPEAHLATPAQQDEAMVLALDRDGARPWKASYHCWSNPELDPRYLTAVPPTSPTVAPTTTIVADETTTTTAPNGETTTTVDGDETTTTTESSATTTTTAESSTTTSG